MIHRVLGTAGHIDHGKTALIRALTGVNTDRLSEEQRRGITIELGFAPLDLGDGEVVGVVDVPGHERFVKTMLAGAGGIDAVLLVVAADESIKPQTREHFDICRLLGVTGGVIALTKSDLVDEELLELARDEVAEWVAGTFLAGAPIVPVSAATNAGVEELRRTLAEMMAGLPAPQRLDFVRLPVDRAFSMKGFGTVVTGTLLSGVVRGGDTLIAWPAGEAVRVRRVQVHGREVDEAEAGQRTALNVTGIERHLPMRGELLATAGRMAASSLLDVQLELLPSIPGEVVEQARIGFHLGTAEIEGRLRLPGGQRALAPGATALAQIRLSSPLAATVGDRFIIRRPTPPLTLGGGRVIDPMPAKHRAGDAQVIARLEKLQEATGAARVALLLDEAGERGLSGEQLGVRTGMSPAGVVATTAELSQAQSAVDDGMAGGRVMSSGPAAAIAARMLEILSAHHRRRPLESGMSLAELRSRAAPHTPDALVEALLRRETGAGRLRIRGQIVAAASFRVELDAEDETLMTEVRSTMRQGGLDPPDPADILKARGRTPARAEALVRLLRDRGEIVRIGPGFFLHGEVLDELKQRLWERRKSDDVIDVPQFKALAGITRRRAIPLLEYLDSEHVTTRRGDARVIRPPDGSAG